MLRSARNSSVATHTLDNPHRTPSPRRTLRARSLGVILLVGATSLPALAQPIVPVSQDRRVTAGCSCGCTPMTRSASTFGLFNESVSTNGSSGGGVGEAQVSQNSIIRPFGISGVGSGFAFANFCNASASSVCDVTFSIAQPQSYSIHVNPSGVSGDIRPSFFSLTRGAITIFSGAVTIHDTFNSQGAISAGQYRFSITSGPSSNQFPTTSGASFNLRIFPDECGQAVSITGPGPFEFDNTDALSVLAPPEPACDAPAESAFSHDVWFRWRAASTGRATFTTCGLTSVDTKIALYAATCPDNPGAALACSDNACGLQSRVFARISPDAEYLLRVGAAPAAAGGPGAFSVQVCPCDFDASGMINSADFFAFITSFLNLENDGDFNADGHIDSSDFFDFLSCFFGPPPACGV